MKKQIFSLVILLSLSVSAQLHRRVLLNNNFQKKDNLVKVAFFDADSTLRVSKSGSVSANTPKDVLLLPFVSQRLAEVNRAGYLIMVVSNQGGVAKGILPIETADAALFYMSELIVARDAQAQIHYIDFADQEDQFRKPQTGMAQNIEAELNKQGLKIDWKNSFMVGDSAYKKGDIKPNGQPGSHFSNSDRLFAVNLKIPFIEPNDFFGWRCHGIDVFDKAAQVLQYRKQHATRCPVVEIK